MRLRMRLLPAVIFGAVLLLSVRVGGLWEDLSLQIGDTSVAETGKPKASKSGTAGTGGGAVAGKTQGPAAPPAALRKNKKIGEAETARRPAPDGDIDEYDIRILQDLARRRRALDKRERAIVLREGLLKAAERRVEQKIAQLKKIQASVKAELQTVQARRGKRFAKLIKIYSNMKAKDAARVFDELELPILIDLLGGMREASSAPIIAAMNPQKARLITAGLARRARKGLRRTPTRK